MLICGSWETVQGRRGMRFYKRFYTTKRGAFHIFSCLFVFVWSIDFPGQRGIVIDLVALISAREVGPLLESRLLMFFKSFFSATSLQSHRIARSSKMSRASANPTRSQRCPTHESRRHHLRIVVMDHAIVFLPRSGFRNSHGWSKGQFLTPS